MPPKARTAGKAGNKPGAKGKPKKGSKGKKKAKKNPIIEDPKFVRELLTLVEAGDQAKLKSLLDNSDNAKKFDLEASAGEMLVKAAEKGHLQLLTWLMDKGIKPNYANTKALFTAITANQPPIVQKLAVCGADINAKAAFTEFTPLMTAARLGSMTFVVYLVECGVPLDTKASDSNAGVHNGWSAMHFACDSGHLEVARYLVDCGASTDLLTKSLDTPAALAAEHGHFQIVRYLVSCGANIHARRRGLTLAQWAAYRCDPETIQYLVSYGAEADMNVKVHWFPEDMTLQQVIEKQFSKPLVERVDRAIYHGHVAFRERAAHRRLLSAVSWESRAPHDPLSFEARAPPETLSFPATIIELISAFDL